MRFKLLMLMGAPILIMAICVKPAYAEEINSVSNSESAYQKGLALYVKCPEQKDASGAAVLFKKAAAEGHPDAQFSLGVLYQNGDGVHKNINTAIEWYTKAANQNHAKAQFNLGHLLFEGIGITRDKVTGIRWFQKAAEQGYAKAQYKVGSAYLTGEGVSENHTLAIEWISKAAVQGDKDAIHTLKLAREMHATKH